MYKLPGQEELLYYMLYAGAALLSMIASIYLLLRRGNAFASDITPPLRLRRWTAALFASMTLSHVAYLPGVFLTSDDDILLCNLIGGLIDSITCFPLAIIVLFTMMQDRRRPLWPIAVMFAPIAVGNAFNFITRSYAFHGLNNIYGTRGQTVRTVVARQLCRPGTQGGVAELLDTDRHPADVRLLCVWSRVAGL